jgi:hypothetical protein
LFLFLVLGLLCVIRMSFTLVSAMFFCRIKDCCCQSWFLGLGVFDFGVFVIVCLWNFFLNWLDEDSCFMELEFEL